MKKWVTKLLLILMFLIPFGQGRDVSVVKAASNTFLNKTKISIQKGEICKLILKNVKNGEKIKWNSSKKSIVTVKAKGTSCQIMAHKKGIAIVTASIGNKKYKCKVTVKNPVITLSKTFQKLTVGESFNLVLKNTSSLAKWSVSNKSIVTVRKISKNKYKVIAKKKGTAVITARIGKKSYKCKVIISQPQTLKMVISGGNTVTINETLQLKAKISQGENSGKLVWKSSDTEIATVSSDGLVKGIKAGEVKITATTTNGSKITASATIKVKKPLVSDFTVYGIRDIKVGESVQLKASVWPSNSENTLKWVSDDESIATVTDSGVVTGVKTGRTSITVGTTDGSHIYTIAYFSVLDKRVSKSDSNNNFHVDNEVKYPQAPKEKLVYGFYDTNVEVEEGSYAYIGVYHLKLYKDGYGKECESASEVAQNWYGWSSSDPSVAIIKNQKVTGVSGGTAVISAYDPNGDVHTCTVKVKARPTVKYSYKVSLINPGNYNLYDNWPFLIYVQTDNPGDLWLSLSLDSDVSWWAFPKCFDDVNYLDKASYNGFCKVEGGYVIAPEISQPGTYRISIEENSGEWFGGEYVSLEVGSLTVQIKDYIKSCTEWTESILPQITTPDMTEEEKVNAICTFVTDYTIYRARTTDDYVYMIKNNGPVWEMKDRESRFVHCIEANGLLANMIRGSLGLKVELVTAINSSTHYIAKVTFNDGTVKYFDAQPHVYAETWDATYIL